MNDRSQKHICQLSMCHDNGANMGKAGDSVGNFFAKVLLIPFHDCWEWIGARTKKGYGYFCFNGRITPAQRAAWIIHYGPIPPGTGYHGTCVLHKCDNPGCVRPDHLFLGSNKDNILDRNRKGRANREKQALSSCRLTRDQIIEAREKYKNGTSSSAIAREYGVDQGSIWRICNYKALKHVK